LSDPLIVEVLVKPGSKRLGLSEEEGALILRVRERPIENEANDACVRTLAAAYGVPKSCVELVSGARSRRKRFAIRRL